MCIRDSIQGVKVLGQVVDLIKQATAGKARSFRQIAGHIRNCLLYTSDAADERSSVDLGGRRIIKKKTTTSTAAVRVIYKIKRDQK